MDETRPGHKIAIKCPRDVYKSPCPLLPPQEEHQPIHTCGQQGHCSHFCQNADVQATSRTCPLQGEKVILAIKTTLAILITAGSHYIPVPKNWHAPAWWLPQAVCIHEHEGAWNDNTGNGYFGGLQFLPGTWLRSGGAWRVEFNHAGDQTHYPFSASIREQLFRAWINYHVLHHNSWSEWGTKGFC